MAYIGLISKNRLRMAPLVTLSSEYSNGQGIHHLTFDGKILFDIFQFIDEDTQSIRFAICQEVGFAMAILPEDFVGKEYLLLGDAIKVCTEGLSNWLKKIQQHNGEENGRCAA